MKTGAAALDILQPGSILVENAASTLGLGWLGAVVMLSGSPMAATSLTLVAAAEERQTGLSEIEGFTMVMGSRLGASFVVLLVAVLYALRAGKGRRRAPVGTAVLALTATAVVYVPATALGAALLSWGPFASLELWDLCALIASSRAYAGSSLHGRIVAMAHRVPRVNLRGRKQESVAESWDSPPPSSTSSTSPTGG